MREIAHLPGPHITCGTRFPSVSVIFSGEKVEVFKRKLDKILASYPDEPRCAMSGNTFDRHGHRSNSLCDHYKNKTVKAEIDKITTI